MGLGAHADKTGQKSCRAKKPEGGAMNSLLAGEAGAQRRLGSAFVDPIRQKSLIGRFIPQDDQDGGNGHQEKDDSHNPKAGLPAVGLHRPIDDRHHEGGREPGA
ncbi:hypothetical protein SDC9_129159 [bioreactor metagenome]|uniref:Uncharacterized protein n=1 Tax=bioreactor metagenome TaxID=1076179 RepID=A0A645CYZ2_9ZZZZ